jgi:hypothetical protein
MRPHTRFSYRRKIFFCDIFLKGPLAIKNEARDVYRAELNLKTPPPLTQNNLIRGVVPLV